MNIFENNVNLKGAVHTLSVSGTVAVTSTTLDVGTYAVWSDVDTYIKVDKFTCSFNDRTTSNGFPIFASNPTFGTD